MRQAGHDRLPALAWRRPGGARTHLGSPRRTRYQRDPARGGCDERPRRGRRETHRARRGRRGTHQLDASASHRHAAVQPDSREDVAGRRGGSARRRRRHDPVGPRRDDATVRPRQGAARVARGSRAGRCTRGDARGSRRRGRGGAAPRSKEEEKRGRRRDQVRQHARPRQGEPRRAHRRRGARRRRSRRPWRVPVPRVPAAVGRGPRPVVLRDVPPVRLQNSLAALRRRATPHAPRRRRQARRRGDGDLADQGWRGSRAHERRHAPPRARRR